VAAVVADVLEKLTAVAPVKVADEVRLVAAELVDDAGFDDAGFVDAGFVDGALDDAGFDDGALDDEVFGDELFGETVCSAAVNDRVSVAIAFSTFCCAVATAACAACTAPSAL
jgi:hypothetical protein